MLSRVTVSCFVGSYLIAMALELTRPMVRIPARTVLIATITLLGLVLQAIYLSTLARPEVDGAGGMLSEPGLFADWYSWSLLLAWAVAMVYFVLLLRRPETTIGYFLIPPVLGLIFLAVMVRQWAPFNRAEAASLWRMIHGIAMLLGAAAVLIGFVVGLMYLVQSMRLKRKQPGSRGLRLPTLEWLQKLSRGTLVFSTVAVAGGTLAGVIMTLNAQGEVSWTSRGILLPVCLLVWLLAATVIEFFYRPARQGRKVAYLTLASFGFLILAMAGVLASGHGGVDSQRTGSREAAP